jgi:hypothetical protein
MNRTTYKGIALDPSRVIQRDYRGKPIFDDSRQPEFQNKVKTRKFPRHFLTDITGKAFNSEIVLAAVEAQITFAEQFRVQAA